MKVEYYGLLDRIQKKIKYRKIINQIDPLLFNKYYYIDHGVPYYNSLCYIKNRLYEDKYGNIKLLTFENVERDFICNILYEDTMNTIKNTYQSDIGAFIKHIVGDIYKDYDGDIYSIELYPTRKIDYPDCICYSFLSKKYSYYSFYKKIEDIHVNCIVEPYYPNKSTSIGSIKKGVLFNTMEIQKSPDGKSLLYKDNSHYNVNVLSINPEYINWYAYNYLKDNRGYELTPLFKRKKIKRIPSLLSNYKNEDDIYRFIWVFDFETTGLNPNEDEILEIGLSIYKLDNHSSSKVESFDCLRKVKVSETITEITSITQQMVDDQAIDDKSIVTKLKELLSKYGNHCLFASYNLYFDASFFIKYCQENNIDIDFEWLDILTIARDRFDYPHKLGTIIDRLKKQFNSSVKFYDDFIESHLAEYIFKYNSGNINFRAIDENHDEMVKLVNKIDRVSNTHRALGDVDAAAFLLFYMMDQRDDIIKYVGLIGHLPKYKFLKNGIIDSYINNEERKEKYICTKVQFFKREYPLYFYEIRDLVAYEKQNPYLDNEIKDCTSNIDFEMELWEIKNNSSQ